MVNSKIVVYLNPNKTTRQMAIIKSLKKGYKALNIWLENYEYIIKLIIILVLAVVTIDLYEKLF